VAKIQAAIIGTGYIASFHARAIRGAENVELVAVCDANLRSAQSFASNWKVPFVSESLNALLAQRRIDSVHILTPPDQHYPLALSALRSGSHVFLEKPMCTSTAEADDLVTAAAANSLKLGVNHNFLYSAAYERLRAAVQSGKLGPIDHLSITHFYELPQIRFGPYESWMLRDPGNAFLEVGPHLLSALLDLVGTPQKLSVEADHAVTLPNGATVFRRWRIHGDVNQTAVDINVDFGVGFPQRTISVRGKNGTAFLDFDANTCTIDRLTPYSFDLDRYSRSRTQAHQILSQARSTLADYLLTTLKLRYRGGPYQASFYDSVQSFYQSVRTENSLDRRIDGAKGREVIDLCRHVIDAAGLPAARQLPHRASSSIAVKPTVLVFGGTGFIGRELIRQLLAANYNVRAVIHRSGAVLDEFDSEHLEVVRADMGSSADLKSLMAGIEFVFHLARAQANRWDDYLKNDVEPTRLIAEACLTANVKRLVYTGTIASFYTGAKAGTITDQTPLDPKIGRRDYYSRAKAFSESLLLEMHRKQNLPVVILRPGIVIGPFGTPYHWGVGMWTAESICQVWGDGKHKLPFVLVEDVASALVQSIRKPDIEGRTYNLVDLPMLSAQDYLAELQSQTGSKLDVRYPSILTFYTIDLVKWLIKVIVRHPDRARVPSYRDWESRTHKAVFDCALARTELCWKPASDKQRLIKSGIVRALQTWQTGR